MQFCLTDWHIFSGLFVVGRFSLDSWLSVVFWLFLLNKACANHSEKRAVLSHDWEVLEAVAILPQRAWPLSEKLLLRYLPYLSPKDWPRSLLYRPDARAVHRAWPTHSLTACGPGV